MIGRKLTVRTQDHDLDVTGVIPDHGRADQYLRWHRGQQPTDAFDRFVERSQGFFHHASSGFITTTV
jgi:hypothetical protein